ncbi:MOSC domain-containing protein [Sulfitobacter sp. HI0129]
MDTLKLLQTMGHRDFGIYARVVQSGTVSVGDSLELT